ncbi:MAG: hypothetical protein ACOCQ9_02645 [Candidatus Brocadiia bacterium]
MSKLSGDDHWYRRMFSGTTVKLFAVTALLATVLSFRPATGQDPEDEGRLSAEEFPLSFEAETTLNAKYVWRGINVVDGAVLQPSVTASYEGLSLNVWGNMDLDNVGGHSGEFTEIDYTLDYTFDGELADISVGTIYYMFPHSSAAKGTQELYLSAGLDAPLSPSVGIYHDIDLADGTYLSLSAGHTFEDLYSPADGMDVGFSLDGSVSYASSNYSDFYYGRDASGFTDALLSLSLPITFEGDFAITPAVHYSSLLSDGVRDGMSDDDNFWGGITLSYSF